MWWMPLSFMCISRLLGTPENDCTYNYITNHRQLKGTVPLGCECLTGGLPAEPLDARPLLLGAVPQPFEQGNVEPWLARRDLEQGDPHRPLAVDARQEPLELDDAAQRRVARELAVQLQPARLLEAPRRDVLEAVGPEAQ